ncbi:MAG: LysR family transcriptional regulator [Alphaproteobacteria bacterium]
MNLHHIRYFLAVCETLNFTRAAEQCHVTQPSLTRAIQNLEHELGCQLFHRRHGSIAVTPVGEAVRRELSRLQRHVAAARMAAAGWTAGTAGLLRIAIAGTVGPTRTGRFFARFLATAPGARLFFERGAEDSVLSGVADGAVDVAIVARLAATDTATGGRALFDEPVAVLMPRGHALAAVNAVPLAALAGERLLLSGDAEAGCGIERALTAAAAGPRIVCRVRDACWLPAMVAEGVGIAVAPEGCALPPEVVARPLGQPALAQTVSLHVDPARPPTPLVCRLLAFIDGTGPAARDRPSAVPQAERRGQPGSATRSVWPKPLR